MATPLVQIPDAHRDAVSRALTETFGRTSIRAITPMTGGRSSALVYRVDIANRSAILRIVAQRTPLTDPVRQFGAMQVASEDGVAPRVYFANPESGIAITAFVEAIPWAGALSDMERIADLGHRVRRLHSGPSFPEFLHAFQCIDQAQVVISNAGATLPPMLLSFLEDFVAMRNALLPHFILRPSHNDLNPGNLLYDGVRPWIIDWESAWQNDSMFDVATIIHWFGFSGDRETALLRGYFHGKPSPLDAAKLEVMRQVVACYYALVFLLLTLQHGELPPPLDPDPSTLPVFADARAAMHDGTLALGSAEDRVRLALVMIHDARRRATRPDFVRSMAILTSVSP
jgi:Ser/Thr protein kinase RdoA (MazF antagonist)